MSSCHGFACRVQLDQTPTLLSPCSSSCCPRWLSPGESSSQLLLVPHKPGMDFSHCGVLMCCQDFSVPADECSLYTPQKPSQGHQHLPVKSQTGCSLFHAGKKAGIVGWGSLDLHFPTCRIPSLLLISTVKALCCFH